MTFYLVGAAIIALAAIAWWLSRPLWYPFDDHSFLESFLADLVSHQSPWPVMEIHDSERHLLTYRRTYADSGAFQPFLERPHNHADAENLGLVSAGNIGAAADAGRRALGELGVTPSGPLRVRYQGPIDQRVVSKLRSARRQSAV